jgi:hypothetical protein
MDWGIGLKNKICSFIDDKKNTSLAKTNTGIE